jgi:iron complex transport system permease protein
MAGGLLTALLVIALARDISRPRFILIGIGVSWAFAAAMGVFMTTADVRDVQTAMLWLAGSLHAANWTLVGLAALWAAPAFALLLLPRGQRTWRCSAIRPQRAWRAHNPAGAAAGSRPGSADGGLRLLRGQYWFRGADCPAYGAPAAARWANRAPDGKRRAGALLVLLADNVGRLAFLPLQLPAGIVISLIGGPFFLLLLWQRRDRF